MDLKGVDQSMQTHNDGFLKGGVAATLVALLVGLGGCSDGGNDTQPIPVGATPFTTFLVAKNAGTAADGDVDLLGHFGAVLANLATGTNQGIALDRAGNLVQAGDNGAATNGVVGIRTFCDASTSDGITSGNYRQITGAATTLTTPRGVVVAQAAGYYFVAQNSNQVLVFHTGAAGNVAPVATLTTDAPAWDLAYDEAADRLFVAQTDGTVAVYDEFVFDNFGSSGTARTITPLLGLDAMNVEIFATNLHGIAYDALGDRLVVSDVGDTASNSDGALYVIGSASTAGGDVTLADDSWVEPSRIVSGPTTTLGNPVDIALRGHELRVAEKGNNAVLYYRDIFLGTNDAPDASVAVTAPESVAFEPRTVFTNEVGSRTLVAGVAVTSNTAGTVAIYDRNIAAATTTFDAGAGVGSIENVAFDANGDGYATFDANGATLGEGGIAIIHRLNSGRDGETALDATRDRTITGATAGLIAPRGVAPLGNSGLVAVAETSASAVNGAGIYVFSACSSGNIAPLMTVPTAAAPWDFDYDPVADRLYVALTDGTVEIYTAFVSSTSDFLASLDPADLPTPRLTLDLSANATNLHGIAFKSNRLYLSDVGDTASATDGKLFVISGIARLLTNNPTAGSTAALAPGYFSSTGGTPSAPVRAAYFVLEITGDASTVLGNPVDLVFDGTNLFVANKTGTPAGLLKYNSIVAAVTTDDAGDPDPACNPCGDGIPDADPDGDGILVLDADVETTATEAESVALVPTFIP